MTQKALHAMMGKRTVSIQEAVHMIDDLPLIFTSEKITYLSLRKAQVLRSDADEPATDLITKYRNRPVDQYDLSLEQYFYQIFCKETFKYDTDMERQDHRMLIPKGMNCRPRYPVDYDYAKGMLLLHKPWNKTDTLDKLFRNKAGTIKMFHDMMNNRQFPSSVASEYACAIKYSRQKKYDIIRKDCLDHEALDESLLDLDELENIEQWQHCSHFTDTKRLSNVIDGDIVNTGEDYDWTSRTYNKPRDIHHHGKDYISYLKETYYSTESATEDKTLNNLSIPTKRDGSKYDLSELSPAQRKIVLASVDTIVKFLNNDTNYKPLRATILGSGGTGKSHIINTIISVVRELTMSNDTIQIAAPSGSAAYNVQGSTMHRLLNIDVKEPWKQLSDDNREKLFFQLKKMLMLVIDERSQVSSTVLAAAERNVRECVFGGQNSSELWGGVPVVLMFGDDYQLMPVIDEGAIQGYAKKTRFGTSRKNSISAMPTKKQLLALQGRHLFTSVMTENVFMLHENYRVKCDIFKDILARVRVGQPTHKDAKKIMNLHLQYYEGKHDFMHKLENHEKTMWLFTNNDEKNKKNNEMLKKLSSPTVPVARLGCEYDSNKRKNGSFCGPSIIHFDRTPYNKNTDICVGARVAIAPYNIVPEVGLYNGAYGKVIEIVYSNRMAGPNDRNNNHLPDYVVVDIPHLRLPKYIRPWDLNAPTVSLEFYFNRYLCTNTLMTNYCYILLILCSTFPFQ